MTQAPPQPAHARRRATSTDDRPRTAWRAGATLWLGLSGSGLWWAALPPLNLWPLAWLAPVPWLLLVRRTALPGRRGYAALWLAGFVYWMVTLHWLRLPHPLTSIGWVALSLYLAAYLPAFVGLARVAVGQLRVPLVVAAPVVWTGLELVQTHLLTGFNMASLGHTQYRWIGLLQICDLLGEYGVTFLVMFVAACVASAIPLREAADARSSIRRTVIGYAALASAAIGAALIYGHLRLSGEHTRPGLKVAVIQGSIDSEVKADPNRSGYIHQHYCELSDSAVVSHADIDLLIWPETMYRVPLLTYTTDARPTPDDDWTMQRMDDAIAANQTLLNDLGEHLKVPMLLGVDTLHYGPGTVEHYNSAVLVGPNGNIKDRYDKTHPVMFGEYIPFAKRWPWLLRMTPLAGNVEAGQGARAFQVDVTQGGAVRVAPNICFESILPHVIRGQVDQLRRSGQEPDVLVNLTNDGWYWGSTELDLHLICGVFRAVETRKPLVIAANTGISAVIDASGRIQRQGPRRATDVLVEVIPLDDRASPYVRYGDWPAGICLALTVLLALIGVWRSWTGRAGPSRRTP